MSVHHYEQSRRNRCVVACARMVLSRLGRVVDEDVLCDGIDGSKRGYDVADAATWIGGRYHSLDPDSSRNYESVRIWLGDERWIIAEVFGREIGKYVESLPEPLQTRWSPLSQDLGLHTVTLVGVDGSNFRCLDPYHGANGQPFDMSQTIFATVWTGRCVVSPPLR